MKENKEQERESKKRIRKKREESSVLFMKKKNLPRANCQCILRCLINSGKVRTTASKIRPHIHIYNLWYWARPSTNTTLAFLSSDICLCIFIYVGYTFFYFFTLFFFLSLRSSHLIFYLILRIHFIIWTQYIYDHFPLYFFLSWLKSKGLPFYF